MVNILKQIRFKIFPIIFHIFFIVLNYKNFSKCGCGKDAPINKQLIYCTKNEFENNICSIDNDIIKDQWLNNFINFNEYNYKYTSMTIDDEGNFILLSSPEENKTIRLFFVLKKNGRPYFSNNDNQEIFTKKIIVKDGDKEIEKFESHLFSIKLNNNNNIEENKQFLVSISSYIGYIEFYDIEDNNIIVSKLLASDFTSYTIHSKKNSLIELENNQYLYIYIGEKYFVNYYFYRVIQKYSFYDIYINKNNMNEKCSISRIINAFKTDSNQIIIFYFNMGIISLLIYLMKI